ncbi:hypothetical protein RIF29_18198 [Crotalaria pallida]|uniref:Protein LURP-one-related 8 n=1 Tax=Crotalaria pallida TaxID=3830 RepID=A0AAN9FIM2_CROPI
MTKVYPNYAAAATTTTTSAKKEREASTTIDHDTVAVLTVWKKSLLLNCKGFTVFDAHGNLVYRVDNYMAQHKDHILLMDAQGTPLLTIRHRKRLSLGDNWLVYEGEEVTSSKPICTVRKQLNKCTLAQVLMTSISPENENEKNKKKEKEVAYMIQGSYSKRSCTVYDNKSRRVVAEIKRKEGITVGGGGGGGSSVVASFGADVFRLIVQTEEMDPTLAMAFLIILDHMLS